MDTKDPRCTADEILYVFSKSKLELITTAGNRQWRK